MARISDLHRDRLGDAEYRDAYDALDPEFSLTRELIAARVRAGLTQEQLAERMGTTQSAIAWLESGRRMPGIRTLERFATAWGPV